MSSCHNCHTTIPEDISKCPRCGWENELEDSMQIIEDSEYNSDEIDDIDFDPDNENENTEDLIMKCPICGSSCNYDSDNESASCYCCGWDSDCESDHDWMDNIMTVGEYEDLIGDGCENDDPNIEMPIDEDYDYDPMFPNGRDFDAEDEDSFSGY